MGLYLGIDTSNYTSSAALLDEDGNILMEHRTMLSVKEGQRGLRQSEALFQHWRNLPAAITPMLNKYSDQICGICVSTRPRPVEGSYMPVFTAGEHAAEMISAALGVPIYRYSHQEGHIAAASIGNELDFKEPMVCAHLSGGTLELVKLYKGRIELIGATRDISYGQLLDRIGVELGYPFPCGKYIDENACAREEEKDAASDAPRSPKNAFSRVKRAGADTNLSGLETQLKKALEGFREAIPDVDDNIPLAMQMDQGDLKALCRDLMERISENFVGIMEEAKAASGAGQVLIGGGVASSRYLRNYCSKYGYAFGRPELCSDNAVGLAYMKDKGLCL